jgi:hypothetical protein
MQENVITEAMDRILNIVVPDEFTGSARGINGIPLKTPKASRRVNFTKVS